MPGALDQLTRKLIIAPLTLTASDSTNVDPVTGATVRTFIAPETAQVKGMQAVFASATGTTPAGSISLRRLTTKLITVAMLVADTPVRVDANVYIEKGETLNLFEDTTVNADNDFAGVLVILELQPVVDESAA